MWNIGDGRTMQNEIGPFRLKLLRSSKDDAQLVDQGQQSERREADQRRRRLATRL